MFKLLLITTFIINNVVTVLTTECGGCGKNEIETNCIQSVCEYRNCSEVGGPIRCVRVDPKQCKKGCICKPDYLRDDDGICIPASECPNSQTPVTEKPSKGCNKTTTCTGQNEIIGCASTCPQTCESIGKKYNCPLQSVGCKSVCQCKPNYFRNKNNECISKENCLKCTGPHEYFSCGSPCDKVCTRLDQRNQTSCPIINRRKCTERCYCENGYARDPEGTCIPIENCPRNNCGINEIYDECPPVCPEQRCDVDEKLILCQPNPKPGDPSCKPGCRCIDNYKKNASEVCIPKEECPAIPSITCRPDEEYNPCANGGCGRWKCSQPGEICVDLFEGGCIEGCRCKEPLLRTDDGRCVPADQCPLQCYGQNEVAGCFTACPQTCDSIGQTCDIVEPAVCIPNCRCKPGFFRNKIGDCVSKDQCLQCSGPNEYFSCGSACDNECATLATQNQTSCPIVNIVCNKKCYCEEDYARNKNGICIPIEQCANDNNCGINEIYDECPPVCPEQRCDVDESLILCLPNPQPGDPSCKPGCRCIDGYKKNASGICIPKEECPPITSITCGPDEEYNSCANAGCGRWECSQQGSLCIDVVEGGCIEGCRCKEPLLRTNDGRCVPEDQCPLQCYGQNEVAGCYTACPQTCDSIGIPCDIIEPAVCTPNCRCKPGFYRNKIGDCISEDQCLQCSGPNEYFSCGPACDNECATLATQNQTNCPIKNKVCNKKCYCEEDFARNKNGICVPIEQCATPIPSVTCGPDEEYNSCANAGCGRWECSQRGNICIDVVEGGCKEGCRCKEPLLRTDDGRCVPEDQCPLQCYGQNEVAGCFTACPQTCDSIGQTCDIVEPAVCTPNCRCKPGFFRNKIGDCISKDQCLQCSGPNEYFSCGSACDNECATLATQNQTNCPIINIVCNEKCYCEEDYARNKNGICIPIEQCAANNYCGINEIYDECPPVCPEQRCDVDESLILCLPNPQPGDPSCKPGCRCIDGYKKNASGVCIPKDECPPISSVTCGPDEEYNSCANGGCGRWECSQPGIICIDLFDGGCKEGCRCKEPLLRADDGRCVPVDQCPLQCYGQNEVAGCYTACPQTCDSIGVPCDIIEPAVCKPYCRCKPGFYRNKIGDCISEDQCLQCSGPNEYFSCGSACDNECATLATQNQTNCPIINIVCNEKCYCEEDYARNKNGICVPIEQCANDNNCGINEIYDVCPKVCPAQRCDVDERIIRCRKNPEPGDPECKPGCRCLDNYKKDGFGVCIPQEKCPPIPSVTCGPDEEYNSCANAGCGRWECSQRGNICIDVVEGGCKEGCRCKEPLLRTDDGRCVPEDQCPLQCYGQNEVAGCFTACPQTCDSIGQTCDIVEPAVCTPNCRCKPGFFRNKIGDCISKDQCLQCSGPNEYFSCGSACDNECATLATQNQTNCPIINIVCNEKCYCEEDYARNKNGICIPIEQCAANNYCGINEIYDECPPVCPEQRCDVDESLILCLPNPQPGDPSCKPGCRCIDGYKKNASGVCIPKDECPPIPSVTCGPDEEYNSCANGGCGRWECSQPGIICIDLFDGGCKEGCRCKEPLLRADDGRCVPADQCPLQCYGQNEVAGCYTACPQTCDSIGVPCDIIEPAVCKPYCRCKPGFYRNKIGDCISEDQCLQCSGPNEYFSCGPVCDNECATLATQNQTNCPIKNIVCNNKCYCEEDYARNKNGICVPIEQCANDNNCGINEIYDVCPKVCPAQRCDVDERIIRCRKNPEPGDPECKPGCRCLDNYKKDAFGVCIPQEKCPPIPSVTCGPDEEYNSCANAGCGRWECSQRGNICIDVVEGGCKEGCRCKEPLLRTDDGRCVPEDQCPLQCYGQNEVAGCFTACPQTCDSIGQTCDIVEPAVCIPNCRCKPGFFRNKIGDCISKDQCLQCSGPNEYFSCGSACDNECATLATQNQTNCPIINIVCNEKCYCEEDYARNKNGICIPIEQCTAPIPSLTCRPDEDYNPCANAGCGRWECSQQGSLCVDVVEGGCVEGCRCKEPLLRTKDGRCVPADQCPPNNYCGINELYDECPPICPEQRCDVDEKLILCSPNPQPGDSRCKPGCRCIDGFKKNTTGICIPKEECPNNCGINEVYDECPPICPPPRCDVDEKVTSCPRNPEPGNPLCQPGCRCLTDYKKNASGVCIPKEECPPIPSIICGPDEEYSDCVNGGCGRWNCSQPGEICIKLKEGSCIKGCRCKKPLLRSEDGSCVPADQCSQTVDAVQKFTKGNDEFTKNFLFLASKVNAGRNAIYSPASLLVLLAQLAYSITGTAQMQLLRILNLDSKSLIKSAIPAFTNELTSQKNISIDLAARVYGNNFYKFSKSFQDDTLNIFKATAQNLDFSNPTEAAKIINDWVALITHNLITDLVPPSALSVNTRIVLVNAIYFKGVWRNQFKKENTKKKLFFVNNDKNVEVDMMNQIGTFKYAEINNPDCQVLQLPYLNSNFTFVVFLPKKKDGIDNLINALGDPSFSLSTAYSDMTSTRVDVSLPTMDISTTKDLADIMRQLNVTDIFIAEKSGMSELLDEPQNISVSAIIQKAKIIVTETGTEAAAGTALIVGVTSVMLPQETITFNANHSFLYLIQYKDTPIFCGIYRGVQ